MTQYGPMADPQSAAQIRGLEQRTAMPGSDLRSIRILNRAMKFRVIVDADEAGVFVAECPTLPGCISQGRTREEALSNIRDAIEGYLASLAKHGEPVPLPITEEVIEIPG